MLTYHEFGKYGVQTTFYFALEDVSDVEAPFTGTAPGTADIWISKDGGAPANATNAMTAIGNGVYSLVLTATEMQATRLALSIYDATASAIFLPIFAIITTKLQLGQLDADASQITNAHGIVATGNGSGDGLHAVAGGSGQITNLFNTVLGAELTAIPTAAAGTVAQFLLALWQRFFHKVTQTATTQTLFKADSTTSLGTATCSNDGTTMTKGKVS